MLRNPFYIGINRFDGKDYPGAQEPIISKTLFKTVQKKLDGRGFHTGRNQHDPVFKSMIRCSICGTSITWSKHKGRYYGRCGRFNPACKGKKMLREDRVERIVIERIEILDDSAGKALRKVKSALSVIQEQYVGYYREKTIEELNKQLGRIRHMQDMLYEDKLAGVISQETYDIKRQHFGGQTSDTQQRLFRLYEAQDIPQPVVSSEVESDSQLVRLYITSTPSQKRLILANLFKNISADGEQINIVTN